MIKCLLIFIYVFNVNILFATTDNKITYKNIEVNITRADEYEVGQRPIITEITKQLRKNIRRIVKFDYNLPKTSFTKNGSLIPLTPLYDPQSGESLSNVDSEHLSDLQLEQIKRDGVFVIPSKKYQGRFHIWKVHWLLQQGTSNISIVYHKTSSVGLRQFIVYLPQHLYGANGLSIKNGVATMINAVYETFALFLGFNDTKKVYSQGEIEQKMLQIKENNIFLKMQSEQRKRKWELRQNDIEIAKHYERIEKEINSKWHENYKYLKIANNVRMEQQSNRLSTYDLNRKIDKSVERARLKDISNALFNDKELNNYLNIKFNGSATAIINTIINNLRADLIIKEVELNYKKLLKIAVEKYKIKLKIDSPTAVLVPEWLDEKIAEFTISHKIKLEKDFKYDVYVKLKKLNLNQQLRKFQLRYDYIQNIVNTKAQQKLESAVVPTGSFEVQTKIWNPKNWGVRQVITIENGEQSKKYFPIYNVKKVVTTDSVLWRLNLAFQRAMSYYSDTNRFLFTQLWSGKYGFKALVQREPFYRKKIIDENTGILIADEDSKTNTLRSRAAAHSKGIRLIRKNFLTQRTSSLVPAWLANFVHFSYYNIAILQGGRVLIYGGIPVVTALNSIATVSASLISTVTSPALAVLQWGLTLNDLESNMYGDNKHYKSVKFYKFPVLQNMLLLGVGGVKTVIATGFSVSNIFVGIGFKGFALLRNAVSRSWDFAMLHLFIKHANLPNRDDMTVKRVAGPGLTADFYYSISTGVAISTLIASLESKELKHYQTESEKIIKSPLKKMKGYLNGAMSVFGSFMQNEQFTEPLKRDENKWLKKLGVLVQERNDFYKSLIPQQETMHLIKQTENDLDKTLKLSEKIVKEYLQKNVLSFLETEEAILEYWHGLNIAQDDYASLSKLFLQEIFGKQFLIALENSEKKYTVTVNNTSLEELTEDVEIAHKNTCEAALIKTSN